MPELTLLQGDVRTVTPDGKFHAILCDPPYELGFMGKHWDKSGVAFDTETWRRLGEFLLPGGFLLAFAGARTQHRIACAIEDAGFEIRDTVSWVYGCLSADTEILVDGRWEYVTTPLNGRKVLAYNHWSDTFEWETVRETFQYDYNDTAYHIYSNNTDQLVSRNHRVIVERCGSYVFQPAETLECQANVPILEDLPRLLEAVCLQHQRTGRTQSVLLSEMLPKDCSQEETFAGMQREDGAMRGVRRRGLASGLVAEKGATSLLLPALPSHNCYRTHIDGAQVRQDGTKVSWDWTEGKPESSLERRRDIFSQAWKLQANQVCEVSRRVHGYGSEGRVYYGTPSHSSTRHWAMPAAVRSGASLQPRSARQQFRKSRGVCQQSSSQDIRSTRHTVTDLAWVEPVHYGGMVWCVSVPSGAFVARRNGKVFVTGNSGFPKSQDVSKAIDKKAGAERELIGTKGYKPGWHKEHTINDDGWSGDATYGTAVTALATDDAKTWTGYGTGLKPSYEPVICARKPLSEPTVAANCVKHGTGAYNIDGSRIGTEAVQSHHTAMLAYGGDNARPWHEHCNRTTVEHTGRWPANLLLTDSDDVRAMFPESKGMVGGGKHKTAYSGGMFGAINSTDTARGDSGSAARFFYQVKLDGADPIYYCAKASRAERDAGLDDFPLKKRNTMNEFARPSEGRTANKASGGPMRNVHPTLKPLDLCRYLAKLILPPVEYAPRRILVPFAGSGSEMIGAMQAGWDEIVGIEQEQEYVEIAQRRIAYWKSKLTPAQTEMTF